MVMENLTHILIFKTNIKTETDKIRIAQLLDTIKEIEEWSVDCDDVDCVLRVVSYILTPVQITELLAQKNFQCEELD